jgi:hypothetical protein
MRVECTLPTNTSKPNSNTINTIEHAGPSRVEFAYRN